MTERGLVSIASDVLRAKIDPLGAQLFELQDADGLDLLWNGDSTFWTGRAPILFPIVGMLADGKYRLGDKTYRLQKHGFARRKLFQVHANDARSATLRLSSDASTLSDYPFAFTLDLEFAIEAATLRIEAVVRNPGRSVLPASFGFHPALRWPLPYGQPRSEHSIRFEHAEPQPIRRIDREGLVRPNRFATPVVGKSLTLADALFEDDAVIFDDITSQRVSYGAKSGPRLEVAFPQTPRLGVWTKPGAGFICIEPWHGVADPEDFKGDFRSKPGIFNVEPGGEQHMHLTISIVAG